MILLTSILIVLIPLGFCAYYFLSNKLAVSFFANLGFLFYFCPNIINFLVGVNSLNVDSDVFLDYCFSALVLIVVWNIVYRGYEIFI